MRILLSFLVFTLVCAQTGTPTQTVTPTHTISKQETYTNELNSFFIVLFSFAAGLGSAAACRYYRRRNNLMQIPTIVQEQISHNPLNLPIGSDIVILSQENYNALIRQSVQPVSNPDSACSVCLENARTVAFVLCGHSVCRNCSEMLLNANAPCPLCRIPIQSRLNLY